MPPFKNEMGSDMKTMVSNVDHKTSMESGVIGLRDTMNQHRNTFNAKLV